MAADKCHLSRTIRYRGLIRVLRVIREIRDSVHMPFPPRFWVTKTLRTKDRLLMNNAYPENPGSDNPQKFPHNNKKGRE